MFVDSKRAGRLKLTLTAEYLSTKSAAMILRAYNDVVEVVVLLEEVVDVDVAVVFLNSSTQFSESIWILGPSKPTQV